MGLRYMYKKLGEKITQGTASRISRDILPENPRLLI